MTSQTAADARALMTPSGAASRYRSALAHYVIGNGGAILIGLIVSYVALHRAGDVSPDVLSIRTVDFNQYFSAAWLILHGHGASIYNFRVLGAREYAVSRPLGQPHAVLPYLYPAYFALALAPLAALPYSVAYILWLIFDCSVLVGTMFALERYAGVEGRRALIFRLAALSCLPVLMALGLGQVSVVLLALFAACFFAARADRNVLAGVALGCAIIKPQYVVPFLIVFALHRRWRALAAFVVTALALLAAPLPILGSSINFLYLQRVLAATKWQGQAHTVFSQHVQVAPATNQAPWNHSFAGFAQLLLPSSVSTLAAIALSALTLVALALYARRSRSIDLALGMAVLVALLVSPHTLAYDLTLLLIPVAVALRYRRGVGIQVTVLLSLLYVMVGVGYKLAFFVPVQLTVVGMCLVGLWLLVMAPGRDLDREPPIASAT